VEVPQVQYVDKVVEVPQVQLQETVRHVPKVETKEVLRHVPQVQVQYVEKQVEVPHIQYVDKIVEVPEVRTVAASEFQGVLPGYSPTSSTSLPHFDGFMMPGSSASTVSPGPVSPRVISAYSPYAVRSFAPTPVENIPVELDESKAPVNREPSAFRV